MTGTTPDGIPKSTWFEKKISNSDCSLGDLKCNMVFEDSTDFNTG